MDSGFNEIFEAYKNMQTRSEIEEELRCAIADKWQEPVGLEYSEGYIDALKWVLWEESEVGDE